MTRQELKGQIADIIVKACKDYAANDLLYIHELVWAEVILALLELEVKP